MEMQERGQCRQLLRDLEAEYPGIVDDYEKHRVDTDDGTNDDSDVARPPARVSLRIADAVPPLFDYQIDLAAQFETVCSARPEANVALLSLPTGAGKTRIATVALMRLLARGDARTVLWLAPTRELLDQAADTASAVWWAYRAATDIELVRADLLARFPPDVGRGFLFATPQMVAARLRRNIAPDPDVVVFDEAHHVEAPLFRQAIERVRAKRHAAVLGLSATPGRTKAEETERLVDFFNGRLLRSQRLKPDPIGILQQRGVLARVSFKNVSLPVTDQYPRAKRSLRHLSLDMDRFRALVRVTKKLSRRARVLVFAASVDHAMVAAAALRRQGIRAAAVSSRDSDDVRRMKLRDFESGALAVLVNKTLLATGYDCPAIRHVVLATQIRSPIMFEQIVGRASRGPMVGGHARSTVWQFDDHLAMHGFPQSYYRYSDYDWRDL